MAQIRDYVRNQSETQTLVPISPNDGSFGFLVNLSNDLDYKNGFSDLELFADAGGVTQLILNTDYELSPSDEDWTSDELGFSNKTIYPQFRITNTTYQNVTVYATFTNFGVYTSADAAAHQGNRLGEMADFPFSITDSGVQDIFSVYGKYAVYCNGSVISKTTNPEYTKLVDILKTEAGGDPVHPFYSASADQATLPDARGRVMRALDPSGTIDPDGASRNLGDSQSDAMQRIIGSFESRRYAASSELLVSAIGAFNRDVEGGPSVGSADSSENSQNRDIIEFDSSDSTSPNAAKTDDNETRMSNIAVNKIIFYA